jgi:hypothetical protein
VSRKFAAVDRPLDEAEWTLAETAAAVKDEAVGIDKW